MIDCKRIEPYSGFKGINIRELIKYREILWIFIWRDLKTRYAQTVGGISWILLQPVFSLVIYTLFFGLILKVPTGETPYIIFFFSGYLPWFLFNESILRTNSSIVANTAIVSKVYFPRILLPLASSLSPIVDFVTAFGILIILMLFFGVIPTVGLLFIPVVILLAYLTSFGFGIILCTLNTKYRDIQNFLPYIIQTWSYASPVVYPISLVPDWLLPIYILNPIVVIIELMRWSVLGYAFPETSHFISLVIVAVVVVIGVILFKIKEHEFADVV